MRGGRKLWRIDAGLVGFFEGSEKLRILALFGYYKDVRVKIDLAATHASCNDAPLFEQSGKNEERYLQPVGQPPSTTQVRESLVIGTSLRFGLQHKAIPNTDRKATPSPTESLSETWKQRAVNIWLRPGET